MKQRHVFASIGVFVVMWALLGLWYKLAQWQFSQYNEPYKDWTTAYTERLVAQTASTNTSQKTQDYFLYKVKEMLDDKRDDTAYIQNIYAMITQAEQSSKSEHTRIALRSLNKWMSDELLDSWHASAKNRETIQEEDMYILWNRRIDRTQIREQWIAWVNELRKEEWVKNMLTHQPLLDMSGQVRSEKMKSDGTWSHKRFADSTFYAYTEIADWFAWLWLSFERVANVTFTENVGQWTLYCEVGDCTDAVLSSLRNTFEYFKNEKWTSNDLHYQTMILEAFEELGIWLVIDEKTDQIFTTMHYATKTYRE